MSKSGHSRRNRVRRWLAALDGAAEVRYELDQDGEDSVTVGAVAFDHSDPDDIAEAICLAIQDAADELGKNTRGKLVPFTAKGQPLSSRLVVVGRPAEGNPATAELDGSDLARRAQDQRHYEALMRLRVSEAEESRAAFRVALDAQSSTIAAQQSTIERLTARIRDAEEREQDLLEQVAEASVNLEDTSGMAAATEVALPLLAKILQNGGKKPVKVAPEQKSSPVGGAEAD